MIGKYDVIVVGGGSTGENVAWYAVDNGFAVAVVEEELVGGECSYWACMPSKALLRPGEALAAARRVPATAHAVSGGLDVEAALASRDAFASHWHDEHQARWLERIGSDLLRGHARLAGEKRVEVQQADGGSTTLTARRAVVVATGSVAAVPPIEGLRDVRFWDNRDATSAKQVPRRLLILGGGVVGVEMAQAWRRLGSDEVTIVEMQDRLVPNEEPFVGEDLRKALEADGIVVLTSATVAKVSGGPDGAVTAALEDGRQFEADQLLVAAGRRARTDDLGLDTVGLDPGRFVEVNDRLQAVGVEGDWLYAVGDVNGRSLLTHQGKYQARLVADIIAGKDGEDWADRHAIPRVIFTDPQAASVGLTEAQARDRGIDLITHRVGLTSAAGGALLGKGVVGSAQLVIDRDRRVVVGATFTGPGVGELLHAATIAIVSEVTLDRLWHAVPAFPTVSEVWLRLLEAERALP